MLADEYPNDPLARPALIWLVQYYASGEQAERAGDAAGKGKRLEKAVALAACWSGRGPTCSPIRQCDFPPPRPIASRAPGSRPNASTPCPAAAKATRGGLAPAANSGSWSRKGRRRSRSCLASRRRSGRDWTGGWTMRSGGRPSRPPCTAACTTIRSGRPRSCSPTTPSSSTSAFVAARPPGPATRPAPGPRIRDADLSAHDRVDVFLDMDRDFATYYRLTIDHRGWTNDSCCGDSTWDPKWYVAARTEGGYWTVEAAIPLRELTSRPPAAKEVWALRPSTDCAWGGVSVLDGSRVHRRAARGVWIFGLLGGHVPDAWNSYFHRLATWSFMNFSPSAAS